MGLGDLVRFLIYRNDDVALINLKLGTFVNDLLIHNSNITSPQFLACKRQNSALTTCQRSQNNYRFCFKSLYNCI